MNPRGVGRAGDRRVADPPRAVHVHRRRAVADRNAQLEIVDDTQVGNIELDVRDAGAQVITHPGRRSIEGQ